MNWTPKGKDKQIRQKTRRPSETENVCPVDLKIKGSSVMPQKASGEYDDGACFP